MGTYKPAAVCRRGHVIASDLAYEDQPAERCTRCGAKVLRSCPSCGERIRGHYDVPGAVGGKYTPPKFCDQCGSPFPWVGRQERIWELQNALDEDEDLDEATRLWVTEQLNLLAGADPMDEKEQNRLWRGIADHAPKLWQNPRAQRIIDTLATEAVRKAIGL